MNGTTRPATAFEDRETSNSDQPALGKRKGMLPSYLSSATPDAPGSFQSFVQRQRQKSQAVFISSGLFKTPAQQKQQHVNSSNQPPRDVSLNTAFNNMRITSTTQKHDSIFDIESDQHNSKSMSTPSQIPRRAPPIPNLLNPPTLFQPTTTQPQLSPTPKLKHSRSQQTLSPSPTRQYLNRFSNIEAPTPAWDTKGRLEDMESLYAQLRTQMDSTTFERNGLEETLNLYKTRGTPPFLVMSHTRLASWGITEANPYFVLIVDELEEIRKQLSSSNQSLKVELDDTKVKLSTTNATLDDARRNHTYEVDDLTRKYRNEIEDTNDRHRRDRERSRKEAEDEIDGLGKEHRDELDRLIRQHKEDINELESRLKAEVEEQRSQRQKEVLEFNTQIALQRQSTDFNMSNKDREAQTIRDDLGRTTHDLERERTLKDELKKKLAEAGKFMMPTTRNCTDRLTRSRCEQHSHRHFHAYHEGQNRFSRV